MSIDEMDLMRTEEQAAISQALTIILQQFKQTGDIGQAIEDIFVIMEEG